MNLGTPYGQYFDSASCDYNQHSDEQGLEYRISPLYRMGCVYLFLKSHSPSNAAFVGAFDIISESLPHLTIILYRVYPDSHRFLAALFRVACFTTLLGTVTETIVAMYLFGQLWSRWTLPFKITTPLLHIAFSAAQFHGTRIFYRMWRKQAKIVRDQQDAEKLEERSEAETERTRRPH
jgi:hypothetical protein